MLYPEGRELNFPGRTGWHVKNKNAGKVGILFRPRRNPCLRKPLQIYLSGVSMWEEKSLINSKLMLPSNPTLEKGSFASETNLSGVWGSQTL